jgi:hypothetical protein
MQTLDKSLDEFAKNGDAGTRRMRWAIYCDRTRIRYLSYAMAVRKGFGGDYVFRRNKFSLKTTTFQ